MTKKLDIFPMKCRRCTSVGTIVEMGLCCLIRRWITQGGLWDWRRMGGAPVPRKRHYQTGRRTA